MPSSGVAVVVVVTVKRDTAPLFQSSASIFISLRQKSKCACNSRSRRLLDFEVVHVHTEKRFQEWKTERYYLNNRFRKESFVHSSRAGRFSAFLDTTTANVSSGVRLQKLASLYKERTRRANSLAISLDRIMLMMCNVCVALESVSLSRQRQGECIKI